MAIPPECYSNAIRYTETETETEKKPIQKEETRNSKRNTETVNLLQTGEILEPYGKYRRAYEEGTPSRALSQGYQVSKPRLNLTAMRGEL